MFRAHNFIKNVNEEGAQPCSIAIKSNTYRGLLVCKGNFNQRLLITGGSSKVL